MYICMCNYGSWEEEWREGEGEMLELTPCIAIYMQRTLQYYIILKFSLQIKWGRCDSIESPPRSDGGDKIDLFLQH